MLFPCTSLSSPQRWKTLRCPTSTNNLEIPVSWRPNGDSDQNVTRAPYCDSIWEPQVSEGAASGAHLTGLPVGEAAHRQPLWAAWDEVLVQITPSQII